MSFLYKKLGKDDAQAFAIFMGNPEHTKAYAPLLSNRTEPLFGLFYKNKLIGKGAIRFYGDKAELTGEELLPAYRGQGLANILIATRIDYINGLDVPPANIVCRILFNNKAAQNAATRNGFKLSRNQQKNSRYQTWEYKP